jgi:hypothetical protein
MKKQLLILAIAAGSALQASAQLVNNGFESDNVGDSVITGWETFGRVRVVNEVTVYKGNVPEKQIPVDGSKHFIDLRAKKSDTSATTYVRGRMIQHAKNSYGQPLYFQFQFMYLSGNSDAMAIFFAFTKFNFSTAMSDTIGTAGAFTNGGTVYPWTKFGGPINWRRNDPADSVHVIIISNAASNTLNPAAALFIDDIRFSNQPYTGIEDPNIGFLTDPKAVVTVYPNPMKTSATVKYKLAQSGRVTINLYDMNGRLVQNVFEGNGQKGENSTTLNRNGMSKGMYIYRVQAGSQVETGKLIISE